MALVKMTRDTPEVPCGKTEGMFPEEAVASLKENGWKVADKASEKAEPKKEEPKEPKVEPKAEEPKVEPKVEEKKSEFKDSKK
jgi:hypothetical protein